MPNYKDKENTPLNQLKSIFKSNKEKLSYFVRWYCLPESEREPWEVYTKKCMGGVSWEQAQNYIYRDDVQEAIQFWVRKSKVDNLMKIYKKMLEKALKGDVPAAKWVDDFSKGEFFDESEDEVHDYLKNINIPGLNKKSGA